MKAENYPQEITTDEADLGFVRVFLEADDLDRLDRLFFEFPMVVKLLLPYDIIVKSIVFGDLVYIHKRFGKDASIKNQSEIHAEWWPLSEGSPAAQQAIKNAQSGLVSAFYASEILPVAFQYRPANELPKK